MAIKAIFVYFHKSYSSSFYIVKLIFRFYDSICYFVINKRNTGSLFSHIGNHKGAIVLSMLNSFLRLLSQHYNSVFLFFFTFELNNKCWWVSTKENRNKLYVSSFLVEDYKRILFRCCLLDQWEERWMRLESVIREMFLRLHLSISL